MNSLDNIQFVRHKVSVIRRHYVSEDDVQVVLSRLPKELWSRLRKVLFKDDARGNRRLGYTTNRARKEITLCALPHRVSLTQFKSCDGPEAFGAIRGSQWPTVAVRRFMLYDVLLHELGHLQVVDETASNPNIKFAPNRKFAGETKAQEFADHWRNKLWSERYGHQDPVHDPPSEEELQDLRDGWVAAHLEYRRGQKLEQAEKKRQASESYKKALDLYPNHSLALERLGALTYAGLTKVDKSRKLDHAAHLLRRALALDPTMFNAVLFLGMTLHRLDERDEARRMFERAISLDPIGGLAKTVYAEHLGYWGEFDKSEDLFKRILKKDPESSLALHYYAHMLMSRGEEEVDEEDTKRAIELLEKAIMQDPQDHYANYLLGVAHSWIDNNERAIRHLREVTRLKPGYKDADELLAKLISDCGQC